MAGQTVVVHGGALAALPRIDSPGHTLVPH